MKKLTFKKAHELHVALWGWLAETGEKSKNSWPGFVSLSVPTGACFACEIDSILQDVNGGRDCENCPIDWGTKTKQCDQYDDWNTAIKKETRKKYAAIIRDLPWRKK